MNVQNSTFSNSSVGMLNRQDPAPVFQHMLEYGGAVLPNTPTEEFENVLFWTFIKSVRLQYAMEFDFI